ncbi:hypothetical protein TKK_0013832 [Trichogramma kaykai]
MPIPKQEDFLRISEGFFKKYAMPNCIGAVDGKHFRIKKPNLSGSLYFNYKKFFSVVLQAVVDSDARFTTIKVAQHGTQNDTKILGYSYLKKAIEQKILKIPPPLKLPGSDITVPHYFIGDGGYPILEYLMKPYRGNVLSGQESAFNEKLSQARVIVEQSFGILTQRWRIFQTTMQQSPLTVEMIIKCVCVLHNVIKDLKNDEGDSDELMVLCHTDDSSTRSTAGSSACQKGEEISKRLQLYLSNH